MQVRLPGASTTASLQRLLAPSLASTSDVTLGGQTFGDQTSTGTLAGAPATTSVVPVLGSYTVDAPGRERGGADALGTPEAPPLDPGLVQLAVDLAGELAREPRDRLELLPGGGQDRVGRAEVGEQRALARRPDAG